MNKTKKIMLFINILIMIILFYHNFIYQSTGYHKELKVTCSCMFVAQGLINFIYAITPSNADWPWMCSKAVKFNWIFHEWVLYLTGLIPCNKVKKPIFIDFLLWKLFSFIFYIYIFFKLIIPWKISPAQGAATTEP